MLYFALMFFAPAIALALLAASLFSFYVWIQGLAVCLRLFAGRR